MRKLSVLLLMVALAFGLAQCKKTADTVAQFGGEKIQITLNVEDGRHGVTPSNGQVEYQNGDIIYVGDGNTYIGALVCTNGTFTGEVATPTTAYLHFYFLGGVGPNPETLYMASTTSFNVNIANQSDNLPVLSYLQVEYVPGQREYSGILQNKCGLVKFVPALATSNTITISGMHTEATIDFATPSIAPTGTTGDVTLYSENATAKWAILLPQAAVENASVTIESYEPTTVSVPAVTTNTYNNTGVNINNTNRVAYIDAEFSVSATTKVKFAKGNLQYWGTGNSGNQTQKWRFADNQYDYLGDATHSGNVSHDGYPVNTTSDNAKAARDYFGWGTSGYSTSYPYLTTSENNYYANNGANASIDGTNYDWGVYNKSNIENVPTKNWRTLTKTEWEYLLGRTKTISGSSKRLAGYATVNDVKGIIVLPDNWDGSADGSFQYGSSNFSSKSYTLSDWTTMEDAGCLFLPAAGYRDQSDINQVNAHVYYWSATNNSTTEAYRINTNSGAYSISSSGRHYGSCVRLAFNVE